MTTQLPHSVLLSLRVIGLASASLVTGPLVASAGAQAITPQAIESATFAEWQARQGVDAPSGLDVEPAEPGEGAAPAPGEADSGSATAEVAVTGQPSVVVETPANTTDVPDETGVQPLSGEETPDPFLVRLQILLDRAHVSPGVIDGYLGENTRKAIRAYEEMRGLAVDGEPDEEMWTLLVVDTGEAAKTYQITEDDLSKRYVETIPDDYEDMAQMEWLGFHGPAEMLAERFHMDEELLKTLNPNATFSAPGEELLVASVADPADTKVSRITVDKGRGLVTAFDESGTIVMSAPATVGSSDTPSPSGTVTVLGAAPDPTYHYKPDVNFTQGDNREPLTLPAGPNGPVGSMWIDLSKPTYGIHGTAHPALIDKTQSHGCVRLTNWDAQNLADLVLPNETKVEFLP
ncbi:Lipoprotein-anchoring transpeptidase ErfK/SrfK [Fulvimarina manganoxydans]|uniref:Lipoprotein-anchoring transpeptidase ErfK/SrfK n=1 Tax=Fulvimarina manganoxydans TaxID=937218 RepID=A0A1W2AIS3_9HYPH|nr:L,D-transpeptidase [Fulvimarina manganoxydans]SMC60460.1 Lipoprotein-anchoring transpeptidase ErfK/SrfK [Fulvimarina manganoxydans]